MLQPTCLSPRRQKGHRGRRARRTRPRGHRPANKPGFLGTRRMPTPLPQRHAAVWRCGRWGSMQQPFQPRRQALTRGGGKLKHLDVRVDTAGIVHTARHIKADIGQQIGLIDHQQRGRCKHVRVFEGFVVPLGDRHHHHLGRFAQIPQRRTHQIADVFNHQQGLWGRIVRMFVVVCVMVPSGGYRVVGVVVGVR